MTNSGGDRLRLDSNDPTGGMSEQELLGWLTGRSGEYDRTEGDISSSSAGNVHVPEWLLPRVDVVDDSVEELEIVVPCDNDTLPETSSPTATEWELPWQFSADETDLSVNPESKRIVSKGLHVLTDERRILLLALIGMRPDGTDGYEIHDKYRKLLGVSEEEDGQTSATSPPTNHIEPWLVDNGLAEIYDKVGGRVRKIRLTDEGFALLPVAGHLIDWAIHNGNIRKLLGQPKEAQFEDSEDRHRSTRSDIEQLEFILDNPKKLIRYNDLIRIEGSGGDHTRRRMTHLYEGGWITRVPGLSQPESNYPVFMPEVLDDFPTKPTNIREALLQHISLWQSENPGPMNLYSLVYHRKYLTLTKRVGGREEFAREVFQEYARLRDEGLVDELNSGTVKATRIALNTARATALRNMADLIRGGDIGSDRYQLMGLQKIAQLLVGQNRKLRHLVEHASIKST